MIRPKVNAIKKLMEERGWDMTALAYHSGLSLPTVYRLLSGERGAGERTIAGLLRAFPSLTFDDLFTVEEEKEAVAR